ncbi:DUF4157 domain-containing protein [Deinococcus sp. Arct2-2]|uniref:eCIS core domain-containing protein n=1 Tax=Deinococcus sp. Arct2-2 TaxID=2568653 RepID=UPI0010A394F4|nr:DUF4157 domain-containing protein [Deinococcus sp. Arct2-2]THF68868.1 DUF4157 domain-containing protein [Deinococcus sp. Arct2-2]
MYESVKRKRATSQAVVPQWSAPAPLEPRPDPVEGIQRALIAHTSRPVSVQRRAAQPVFQAGEVQRGEVQRLTTEQAAVQRQLTALPALPADAFSAAFQRQQTPATPPLKPQSPAEWVAVMRFQAEQVEGRLMDVHQAGQFTALQRQVAQVLQQGYRQDRQPPAARQAQYAEHLVALQRHPASGQVARAVMALIPTGERPALQRAVDEALQRQASQDAQDQAALTQHALQRKKAELEAEALQPVLKRIQARRGAGNPLPAAIQRHLEQGLNHDLSRVRIHDDAEADKLSKKVNALAFTTGTDIYFRSGHFNPNTQSGLELLAHEVTHTVQQSRGRVGQGIDPDAELEDEARTTGAELARTFSPASFLKTPHRRSQAVSRSLAPLTPSHAAQRVALQRSPWGDWWGTFKNKALELALEGAAQVPNGAVIVAAFKRSQGVFQKIFANPGAFFSSLFGAVGNGFKLFRTNIERHLKTALLDWLTGTTVAATGGMLAFPKTLDGKELLGFGMNLLNLNTATLLKRLGKRYGAANVQKAQGQLAVLQQAKGGLHRLNEFRSLDSQAKTGMLTAARGYAMETVAQQAVVWVSGFLATGGLGPVAKAAFSLVSTFLQNAQTFGQVGAGILDSVQDIAAGQTAKAAQTVEQNLGRVTGLVLKFVSKLLGLDKIGGALRRGLTAVQKPINTAIDNVVGSKPVQAVFQKLKAAGGTVATKVTGGLNNIWIALRGSAPRLTEQVPVRGTKHHLWVELQGERPVVIMASNPLPLRQQLTQMEKEAAAFLSGPEKAMVNKAQSDANGLVDTGIQAMLSYVQTRPRGANPTADEAWLRANTKAIRGKLATLGKDTITKVNARIAPAVALLDQHITSPDDLGAAIDGAGGIIAFLQAIAAGRTVGGLNRAKFAALWTRTTAGSTEHRREVIERFRAAMPGHHEWIPCDLILEVVEKEFRAQQLGTAVEWVKFQHLTRSLTQYLVFKTPRVLNGKALIQGHSGAAYLGRTNLQNRTTYTPETTGQADFHNALRSAFRTGSDHTAVVGNIHAVMTQHLWNGHQSFSLEIHPDSYWRSGVSTYLNFKKEYASISKVIAQNYTKIKGAIH